MSDATVTIVIPTYRRPDRLRRAVQSALSQKYTNIRVVVFDNASSDDTAEVMRDLQLGDPRVEYVCHDRNIGMIENFNFALASINTPFFAFLSDDDYLLDNFIEDSMHAFDAHPKVQVAIFAAPTIDEKGAVLADQLSVWPKDGVYAAGESIVTAIQGNHPIIITCVFRIGILDEVRFDKAADSITDLPILISILARHPFYLSRVVGGYFVRHSNTSGEEFAKLGNYRRLSTAYLRVEEIINANLSDSLPVRGLVIYTLKRRIDKIFFFLFLKALAGNTVETADYLQDRILERSSSGWQVLGRLTCFVHRHVNSDYIAATITQIYRALRFVKRSRSR